MKEKQKELILIFLFFLLSIFVFRNYFLKKTIPFPANLLVAFYEPLASYKWEGYPNGPPSKPLGFDNLRIFYPLRKLTVDQLQKLELPLWNPYNFSGNTQLATYQSAVFHPLSFLFIFLPQIDAWSIIIILSPFFSALFMYLFLKELSLSRKASFFGAITFAFSGFMIVWWEESFMSSYSSLFLPLILYSIERIFKKITARDFILLTLGITFSVLSGWFQMTFYVLIFSAFWIVFKYLKEQKDKNQKLFTVVISYLLSFLISAVHLIPSIEAYFYSARGTTDAKFIFDAYLQPWYHLVTYLAPDFFGNPAVFNYLGGAFYHEKVIFVGIIPFIFAIYEFVHFKNSGNKENFFKWAWIITLSLGFAVPTSWFLLYYLKIPFISVILPSRIFFLSTFAVSVLAAFGMQRFLFRKLDKKRLLIIFIFLGVVFILLWAFSFYYRISNPHSKYLMVPFKNLILPQAIYFLSILLIMLYIKTKKSKQYVYIAIIFVSFFNSAYLANKYLYFSQRNFVFPQVPVISEIKKLSGINRFWGVGKGYMDRNFATYYNLYSPEGYDSFYIQRYGELMYAGYNNGKFSNQIPRTDAIISGVENLTVAFKDFYRKRLMSLLGVKYVIADNTQKRKDVDEKENIPYLTAVWHDDKFTIYENKDAIPRIFLTNDFIFLKNNQAILNSIFSEKIDLSKTIILEEKPSDFAKENPDESFVEVISYTPNKITIKTQSNIKSLLFLSDNYYPGWKAYVDNKETKIYRADYSFRSIVVPKGKHVITFNYKPTSFYLGVTTSILSLLMFLIIGIKIRYRFR